MPSRWRLSRSRPTLILLTSLLSLAPVYADVPVSGHDCSAPVRPANDQDDVLWQRFLGDVDTFRACISGYADANHRASEEHRQAANQATLDWNRFVRAELNVPEDYPWPPVERDPATSPGGR